MNIPQLIASESQKVSIQENKEQTLIAETDALIKENLPALTELAK